MKAKTILVIRHAEKPDDDGNVQGVQEDGDRSPHDLTVRGWQRAGALVRFFAPHEGGLKRPDAIFAAASTDASPSKRARHTVRPLAHELGLKIHDEFAEGQEAAMIKAALNAGEVVLIAWHHGDIPAIAACLGAAVPASWNDDRFDLIWAFERRGDVWAFRQVPLLLLPGDRAEPIAL